MLLILCRKPLLVFKKQLTELEQRGFNRPWIDAIGQGLHHLRGDKTIQILDGGQMCERIASREFDWTRDTVQPLLKLFRGVGLGRAPYHGADRIIASPPPQRAGQPF